MALGLPRQSSAYMHFSIHNLVATEEDKVKVWFINTLSVLEIIWQYFNIGYLFLIVFYSLFFYVWGLFLKNKNLETGII